MKTVQAYEVIDHGFENTQYFQGCGTAFTDFDDVATGTGENAKEAFDDAVDSLAQNDWNVATIKGKSRLSRQTVRGYLRASGCSKEDMEESDVYAYVSIRVK